MNFDWINIFWTHSLSKAYPVIGVMEHVDKSLRVVERRLPTFFGGIHDIYYRELKGVFFHLKIEISTGVRATQEYSEEEGQHQPGSKTSFAL